MYILLKYIKNSLSKTKPFDNIKIININYRIERVIYF